MKNTETTWVASKEWFIKTLQEVASLYEARYPGALLDLEKTLKEYPEKEHNNLVMELIGDFLEVLQNKRN